MTQWTLYKNHIKRNCVFFGKQLPPFVFLFEELERSSKKLGVHFDGQKEERKVKVAVLVGYVTLAMIFPVSMVIQATFSRIETMYL